MGQNAFECCFGQYNRAVVYYRCLYLEGMEFWDDMNDLKPLDWDMTVKARKLEMDFFKKMRVYTKVPRSQIPADKIITTRWIFINKGDDKAPDYRCRLVGREIKKDQRLDLFAATPPLESL